MNTHPQQPLIDFLLVGQQQETFNRDIGLLQKAGYKNVQFVESGLKARAVLKSCRVKFVISELEMPHMTGIELLKMIRRNPALVEVPVLLTSSSKNKETVLYALDELADGFLVTPYSGEDFLCAFLKIKQKKSHLSELQKKTRNARLLFLRREYENAIAACRALISHDEGNIDILLILSECYYRLRDIERARQFLKKVLKINATNSKAMHLLSKVCRLDADCGEAFSLLSAAHAQNPLNIDLKVDLGKFFLETDMEEKAQEIFEAVLATGPSDLSLIKIGRAFLKKNRLGEAKRFLDKTVQPLPETAYIFEQFATAMGQAGEHAACAEYFQRCLRLCPANHNYVLKQATALAALNQKAEAREALKNFLKTYPDNPEVANMLNLL